MAAFISSTVTGRAGAASAGLELSHVEARRPHDDVTVIVDDEVHLIADVDVHGPYFSGILNPR